MSEETQPIRLAATIVLLREAQSQFEIFMLKRTSKAAFAGGMHVFPGGAVEAEDGNSDYESLGMPSEDQAGQTAAAGANWRDFWIAGIRETFEESGYLLAYDQSGAILSYTAENESRFSDYRRQLHKGEITLAKICRQESLTLALDRIHFYNRLITPPGRPRRFDTYFFVTQVPASQTGLHDGTETVDSLWISPDAAIRGFEQEEFGLMSATLRQLKVFSEYADVAAFMLDAQTKPVFPTYANSKIPPGS